MKRKYNPIRCMYCEEVGHNKRTCIVPPLPEGAPDPEADDVADTQPIQTLSAVPPAAPNEQTEIPAKVREKPPKIHVIKARAKKNTSPKPVAPGPVAVSVETIKGSSSATAKKLASFMIFVPTPGFKLPRKKDKE
ncbi:hypothetical protein Ahy_B06g084902 [Arachis hypogaea]|uniref:CCHC-type domain-containing protein n=1 Tax=Arachis hypogaea TaxID=3818 RepID=A0A444YT13_ARAHY|nr:hypothetical protein Ahy_B06g084902 [Arachis hypogaea]